MKTNFKISIPSPCQERWEEFTPTSTGRFCSSCQKNVVDFSTMSESQLVAYFRDLPTDNQHLCGRFRDDQLQKNYDIDSWFPAWNITDKILNYEVPISQFKTSLNTVSLPLIHKTKMVRNITMAVLTFAFTESFGQQKQIHGQVVDNLGSPLCGVNILIKNSKKSLESDKDGKYNLTVNEKDTLVFSFVGYEHKTLIAREIKPIIDLKEDSALLEEVVVIGYATKAKISVMAGGIAIMKSNGTTTLTNENPSHFQKIKYQKYATQIRVLGNPTVTNEVMIVPQIHEKAISTNLEEKCLSEKWYAENAFQNVESVEVYDLSGKAFETNFLKINDGKIKVNLKNVPSGMCIIRITYTNELSLQGTENSAVQVMINR